jgi:hypothetical protein
MARFTAQEWGKIFNELENTSNPEHVYGLPERRDDSLIFSSFNIRALGNPDTRTDTHDEGRTQGAWDFLAQYVSRCDFIAIQEVKDDLSGLLRLKDSLDDSDKYAIIVSDVTGARPGVDTTQERLAFLYRWDRIERTELASDVTYDRRSILGALLENWDSFIADFREYDIELERYKTKLQEYENGLRSKPDKPPLVLSKFLTFIRTPHVASFQILGKNSADPIQFHAVNAHLLYGDKSKSAEERKMEFDALVDWLVWRTKANKNLYHKNMILFGDMNLEFEKRYVSINDADVEIKDINTKLARNYSANFPFLSIPNKRKDPPLGNGMGRYTSTARMKETYDQIGLFGYKGLLPDYKENENAGKLGEDGFDYGVFTFADLFSKAIHGVDKYLELSTKKSFVRRFEHDVSDHHPIWVRLPKPGANI